MGGLDMRRLCVLAAGAVVLAGVATAEAHFSVLMPEKVSVAPRGSVAVDYWVGHPYEHILANAAKPAELFAVAPGGDRQDLLAGVEQVGMKGQDDKTFTAWRAKLKADQRGDYTLVAVSQPTVEDGRAHRAIVKAVVHARVQGDWDRNVGLPAEFVPLTRPYGLRPGMAFQVRLLKNGQPLAGATVEFERYNPQPVAESDLPAEEYITYAVKTGPDGIATMSFPQVGWWGITSEVDAGAIEIDGKQAPLSYHPTYWLLVDEPRRAE